MSGLEVLIRTLIRRELDAREAQAPNDVLVGTVLGVPDTSREVLVSIGEGVTPISVPRPAGPTPLREGDRITIHRGPEGYLLAGSPLDRDPDPPLIAGDTDPDETVTQRHSLGLHTALGLATLEDIASHADGPGHLVIHNTPNTLDLYDGQWSMLGEGSILDQFGSLTFHVMLNGAGSAATTWTRGTLRGKVFQSADFGSDPDVVLELLDFEDITGDDLAIVVTDNSGPTEFSLWARVTRQFEWLSFTPLWVRRDRCSFDWTPCSDFEVALP